MEPVSFEAAYGVLLAHSAAIAAGIRTIVRVLKLPLFDLLWGNRSKVIRLLLLVILTAVAVLFENLALGKPIFEALFVALNGLAIAVSSHEIQDNLVQGLKEYFPKPEPEK